MFGKIFETLYSGSMVGAGPVPFALMPYVIAHSRPSVEHGGSVELNPKLLAAIIGCTEEDMRLAIVYLCSPDPESRSKKEDGRRLMQVGQFEYRVVNFQKYRRLKQEKDRRDQNREAQRKHRARAGSAGSGKAKLEVGMESRRDYPPGHEAEMEAFEKQPMPLTPGVKDIEEWVDNGVMPTEAEKL